MPTPSTPSDTLWIVHADPDARALLRRLAGAPGAVASAPGELAAEATPPPRVVLLHAGADLAAALDFAHRVRRHHPGAAFVLLRDEGLPAAALAESAAELGAEVLAWPGEAERIAAAIARAGHAAPTGLRARRERDALARRFALVLGDLALPDLGGLRSGRLVIRGEPGTGKLLAARVAHAMADPPGAFVHVSCAGVGALATLAERLLALRGEERVVVCLDQPNRLSHEAQRELAGWIELGPPGLALDPERALWVALLTSLAGAAPLLESTLAAVLRGVEVALPPLRARPAAAERFARATLRALAAAAGQPPRELSHAALARIRSGVWPGNFRELEAALREAFAQRPEVAESVQLPPEPEAPPERSEPRAAPVARPPEHPRRAAPPAPAAPEPREAPASRPLLQALAHALRNPLVSLKTFAELLPEQFADAEFRGRFREQAGRDLADLEHHLDRLAQFAELAPGARKPVNVAALLEAELQAHRDEIRARRLLVLSELGADAPWALASEDALRFAFAALFDATFAHVADRQDLYVACRRPTPKSGAAAPLRILLRFHGAPLATLPGREGPASLELLLAQAVLASQGGLLAFESPGADEQVLRIDLPAAPVEAGAPTRGA